MVVYLCHRGYGVNRKRVQRLMRLMGIAGVCPGPNTSLRQAKHAVYPYLLRGFLVDRPNQVWSYRDGEEITSVQLERMAA